MSAMDTIHRRNQRTCERTSVWTIFNIRRSPTFDLGWHAVDWSCAHPSLLNLHMLILATSASIDSEISVLHFFVTPPKAHVHPLWTVVKLVEFRLFATPPCPAPPRNGKGTRLRIRVRQRSRKLKLYLSHPFLTSLVKLCLSLVPSPLPFHIWW